MKKLLFGLMAACLVTVGAQAQQAQQQQQKDGSQSAYWPAAFAFNDSESLDIVGVRLNIPEGYCENMTGFDFGIIGRARYYNGLQLNLVRNAVVDNLAGWQIGIYNSTSQGEGLGLQTGLWNESRILYGVQVGLVNLVDYGNGIQVGLINRAEDHQGFQIGLVNIIRNSRLPFFPIVNVGLY